MRIALVYDCLYPHTIGGAERWYRDLAERLARRHRVTYLTRRQWRRGEPVEAPAGVEVIVVSGGRRLYTAGGRRGIVAPLRFGAGVLRHLLRHRNRYDVVHLCGFPYFPLIAARLARAAGGPPVVADWFEVWSDRYWKDYLGPLVGRLGGSVQRLAIRLTDRAFVFSRLGLGRLREAGYRGEPILLSGMYAGALGSGDGIEPRDPLVVFVGRHIADKQVTKIPAAVSLARESVPGLRALIFGDGPEHGRVLAEVRRLGLEGAIRCPGFRPEREVGEALAEATCLVLPSLREGYGLVVVEAAARGTPAVVTRAADSAAAELVADGRSGLVVDGADPAALAAAIVRVHEAGAELRRSTLAWYAGNAERLSIDRSIEVLEAVYAEVVGERAC